MYFNVNFNVFFKLIKLHLLVSELYSLLKLLFLSTTLEEIRLTICFNAMKANILNCLKIDPGNLRNVMNNTTDT